MSLLVNLLLLLTLHLCTGTQNLTEVSNQTFENSNQTNTKTKRTIVDTQNYGESKPVLVLVDNIAFPASNIPTLYNKPQTFTLKPVFDPDIPKHVAAQQVLYEFQQTPTNAVSNVHVNQLFQPFDSASKETSSNTQTFTTEAPLNKQPYARGTNQLIQSESIASPVQHTALINHGQNYAQVQFHPSIPPVGSPQHIQTHHYIPGKYLYVNGKIIYQPVPLQAQQSQNQNVQQNQFQNLQQFNQQQLNSQNQNSLAHTGPQTYGNNQNQNQNQLTHHYQNQNHPQNAQRRPVSYITYHHNPRLPKQNLSPPPKVPAVAYSKFQPPVRLQQITKPMPTQASSTEEKEEESDGDDKAPVKEDETEEAEDEEDDEGEKSSYRYDDEDEDGESEHYESRPGKYFSRYSFNDDEDDDSDRQGYHRDEEDDDEDSHRGSSKVIPTKTKKHGKKKSHKKSKSPKYDKSGNYKYREGYRTRTEYESPSEKPSKRKHKSGRNKHDKGLKFKTVKYTRQSDGKPKIETIEGRQSQVIPVIEKRKIFQEKWVVKSSDASTS